ncbi:hypothetical protein BC834DRAFT_335580 [Gloeopeniophorella convolvens]|nr:hypothetical protein BC834DRAFT_335580 [Gloeopeniophorella convolvens]
MGFNHVFEDLSAHTFGAVTLFSQDGHVKIGRAPTSERMAVFTRHGHVWGKFNVSSSLKVASTDAPIFAQVAAYNDGGSRPTSVTISTTNSSIVGSISLLSTRANYTGGAFRVSARTEQSPLELEVTEQPPDSDLILDVRSSGAISDVYLRPAYEGALELLSAPLPPLLDVDPRAQDPAGRGRTREVLLRTIARDARLLRGSVAWVPRDEGRAPGGLISIVSMRGGVRLFL